MIERISTEVPSVLLVDDDIYERESAVFALGFLLQDQGIHVNFIEAEGLRPAMGHLSVARPTGVIVDGLYGNCWPVLQRTTQLKVPAILYSNSYEYVDQASRSGVPALMKGEIRDLRDLMIEQFALTPTVTPK